MTNPVQSKKDKIDFPSNKKKSNYNIAKSGYVFYQYNNIKKGYSFISPATEELTGYTFDDLNEIGFENIIKDKIVDHTHSYSVNTNSIEKIKESFATYLIETKAGKLKWIADNSFTYMDSSGKPKSVTGILQDVSASMKDEKVKQIILEILNESNSEKNINELFKFIHASISKLMKADNFYIAYYNEKQNLLTFPYFVDEKDTAPSASEFGNGFTEYIIRTGKSELIDIEIEEELISSGEVELRGPQSPIWLGVPLKIKDKIIGAMVVQDYKDAKTYDLYDKQLFDMFAYPISRAIERKIVEEEKEGMIKELKELNQSKDRLFSLISHDLKSPFNSLLGFANILTHEYETLTQQEIKEYLKVINDSSLTLFGMTTNLLHYSGFQLGKYELRPKALDLSSEIKLVLKNLKERLDKKDILVINEIEEKTFAFVDKDMINLIFTNLISNSIKYSKNGGMIKISTEIIKLVDEGLSRVQIAIRDDGEGISRKNLEKIDTNEKFSTSGTDKECGTGLGLLLVKEAVVKNKGSFNIESETGKGTVVYVTLPIDEI